MLDCLESEDEIEFQEPDPGPTGFHAIRPEGVAAPQSNDPPPEPFFGLRGPQALPVEPLQEQAGVELHRCQTFNSHHSFKSEYIENIIHQRSLLRTLCHHPPQGP